MPRSRVNSGPELVESEALRLANKKLWGTIATDPAGYRRERFAKLLANEPVWIARASDSYDELVCSYYRQGVRVGYIELDHGVARAYSLETGVPVLGEDGVYDLPSAVERIEQLPIPDTV